MWTKSAVSSLPLPSNRRTPSVPTDSLWTQQPTTGLHFDDISRLLGCFDRLIETGNSELVIEHNLDVIKCGDWVIDLGPEGGDEGGRIVAQGIPEEVAECGASYTGQFLKGILNR